MSKVEMVQQKQHTEHIPVVQSNYLKPAKSVIVKRFYLTLYNVYEQQMNTIPVY